MQRMHQSKSCSMLATLITAVVVCSSLLAPIAAQAQRINQAVSVAVVPFADKSERATALIADKATDAIALALDDSQEYVITPRTDTEREMAALSMSRDEALTRSFSEEQMVRLGERLRVDKISTGSVDNLSIDKSGRCRIVLTVRLLDVATQEYLDGATVEYETKPVPGWSGDEAGVMNEALRSASESAIAKILTNRRPRGNIDMVDQSGAITINLGFRDGMVLGAELLVVRGVWNASQERVELRKLGVIKVKEVEFNMSRCSLTSGTMPRTGDKCYTLYRPTQSVEKAERKATFKKYLTIGAAVAAVFGLYRIVAGDDAQGAPGISAFLSQASPGAEPRVQVTSSTGGTGSREIFGWLVYRGESRGFAAEADSRNYLIAALRGESLGVYEDQPTRDVGIDFDMTFQYLTEDREQEDATVTITYNHVELVAGDTYYYKLRRIMDPGRIRIPISTTQVSELEDVSFEIEPNDALSDESNPGGPVTFFYPAEPELPSDGNSVVDASANKTLFTWEPSVGADEYRVFIYDNASGTGTPVKISPILVNPSVTAGGTMSWRLNTNLESSTTYYWFVGARRNGETEPIVQSLKQEGWILSGVSRFTTSPTPPDPPSSSAVTTASGDKVKRPADRPGWWDAPGR